MTIIPGLNIVVQQGGAVKEAHNLKAQPYDSAQAALSVQAEREAKRQEEVQLSEEAYLKSGRDGRKKEEDKQERRKDRDKTESREEEFKTRGSILDTKA